MASKQPSQDFGTERAGLLWPTIATAMALAILIALGTWQLQRMTWKEDLVRKIEARSRLEPALVDAAAALREAGDDMEYARVRARGRFSHENSLLYYASGQSGPGYHVYTPLLTSSGVYLIVNRGFIPEAEKGAALASRPASATEVEVVGLIRKAGGQGWFTPPNDVVRNLWYWRDLKAMAAVSTPTGAKVFPFFIEELAKTGGAGHAPGEPRGGATRLEVPNRHFEYALTWYGFAIGLIGVYLTFAWGRRSRAKER